MGCNPGKAQVPAAAMKQERQQRRQGSDAAPKAVPQPIALPTLLLSRAAQDSISVQKTPAADASRGVLEENVADASGLANRTREASAGGQRGASAAEAEEAVAAAAVVVVADATDAAAPTPQQCEPMMIARPAGGSTTAAATSSGAFQALSEQALMLTSHAADVSFLEGRWMAELSTSAMESASQWSDKLKETLEEPCYALSRRVSEKVRSLVPLCDGTEAASC